MKFTNVGEEQTVSREQTFRNRSPFLPGLFSSSQEFQGVPDYIPSTPGESRTAHWTVPVVTTLSTVPTTHMWGAFDGSNNLKSESFISNQLISDTNQTQQKINTAGIDNKWKKFVLRWIRVILSLILVTEWFSVTLAVKVFIDETSGPLEHFKNQNENSKRPTDTVRHILDFEQNILHIRDNAKSANELIITFAS